LLELTPGILRDAERLAAFRDLLAPHYSHGVDLRVREDRVVPLTQLFAGLAPARTEIMVFRRDLPR